MLNNKLVLISVSSLNEVLLYWKYNVSVLVCVCVKVKFKLQTATDENNTNAVISSRGTKPLLVFRNKDSSYAECSSGCEDYLTLESHPEG